MVRHRLLLSALLVSFFSLHPVSAATSAIRPALDGCSVTGSRTGQCEVEAGASVGDGGVDVSAGRDEVTPGAQGTGSGADGGTGGGQLPDGVSYVPGGVAVDQGDAAAGPFMPPRRGPVVVPAVPACPPQTPCDPDLIVRVSDLVSIRADHPTQGMEPDGWAVVGVPANFFATASTHVRTGLLLGAPAEVSFTPVQYRWDYGDGTSRTAESGGGSWAGLGLPEFSDTPTSHVFEQTGTLVIGLTVSYAAEFRFAGGAWRPVVGLVEVPSDPISALADLAGTVLVAKNCSANPRGPGC